MIQLTWLQFRLHVVVAIAAMVAFAILLAITGRELVHLYDTTIVPCSAQGNCETARSVFLRHELLLQHLLSPFLMVVPALLGIFWGAPLVARELESGTYRLAWTQSVSRFRWLVAKLGVIGLASMAVAGLTSLMVTWWFRPFDHVNANRFSPGVFDSRGIVAIGYAAFAFALGVTAGVVLRRMLPAMGVTLVAFLGARLAMIYWVRPHLMPPAHLSLPIDSSRGLGFTLSSSGVTFVADTPSMGNAWALSSDIVDRSGHVATTQSLHQFLVNNCPAIVNAASGRPTNAGATHAPANQTTFNNCIDQLSKSYHLVVTYQPASRYWTFQWYELAIFLALAVLLGGFSVWWVRARLA